jgi:hypothetical protein
LKLKTAAGGDVTISADTHPYIIKQLLKQANGVTFTSEDQTAWLRA